PCCCVKHAPHPPLRGTFSRWEKDRAGNCPSPSGEGGAKRRVRGVPSGGLPMLLHDESPSAVEAREKNFILGTYARTSFHPRSGRGARLTDAGGNEYWDLLGGIAVNVLGHQHPRLVKTLKDESR